MARLEGANKGDATVSRGARPPPPEAALPPWPEFGMALQVGRTIACIVFGVAVDDQKHLVEAPRLKLNRKRQPVEVRARIIDAAVVAFTQDGFKGARMRSIAADAGISIQLLIHHVKTKELLWHAVMEHFLEKAERFDQQAKSLPPDTPASERLRQKIIDLVHFTAATPELHRIMTNEAGQLTPRMVWLAETFLRATFREWCSLIEDAQREGAVRDVSPARLRYAIIAMGSVPFAVAAEYEFLTGKSPFGRSEVDHTIELICNMVFLGKA